MSEGNEDTKAPTRRTRNRRRLNISGPGKATSFIPTSGTLLSDRYRLDEEIGRGGMGVVYKAFDQELEIPVAIKLLPPELASSKRAINDLKREAVLAMRLRHPGIMALYHFDDSEDVKYLVMELLVGGTIDDRLAEIEEGYLPVDEVIEMAQQLAAAVDYAHSEKVIHRDIKPNNIFLHEKDGATTPRIMDFGIARQIKDCLSRVSNQDSAGTLFYMSPEQLQGKPVDNRSDIYSLAATYYECLSGAPPFHSGSVSFQIVNKAVDPIEGIPDHVNDALLKALSKDPEDRFSSATEFAKALTEPMAPKKTEPEEKVVVAEAGAASGAAGAKEASEAKTAPPKKETQPLAKKEVKEPPPPPPLPPTEKKPKQEIKQETKKEEPKKDEPRQASCMQRGCSCLFWLLLAFVIFALFCYLLDEAGVFDTPKPTSNPYVTSKPTYRPPTATYRPTKPVYKPTYTPTYGQTGPTYTPTYGQTKPTYAPTTAVNPYARIERMKVNALQMASEGRADEAVSILTQLHDSNPEIMPSLEPVVEKLVEKGNYQQAINALVLFDERSKDADLWTEIGKEALDAQKNAPAAKCFSKAISLSSDAAEARYHLAQICLQKGKTARARELLQEACAAQPWNTTYRSALEKIAQPSAQQQVQQNNDRYQRLLQQNVISPRDVPKAQVKTGIAVHKEPNVHVLNVFVTYTPVDQGPNPLLQRMEATLVEKNDVLRAYVLDREMPPGRYTVSVEVTGRNAIFKNIMLRPRSYTLGVHNVVSGMNQPVMLQVQAPSVNDTGGGY